MMNKLLLLMLAVLLVGTISALDTTKLKAIGINQVDINEYPCQDGVRCFALSGDVNNKLIEIPTQVRDNCITKETIVPMIKVIQVCNKFKTDTTAIQASQTAQQIKPKPLPVDSGEVCINKTSTINVVRRDCTGVYNYRTLSDDEVNSMVDKAYNSKLDSMTAVKTDYYNINKNSPIKTKSIEIGKSVGGWVGGIVKDIGGLVGIK